MISHKLGLGIIFTILFFSYAFAQVEKDRSYNLQSEYEKQIKKYPEIKVVANFDNPNVKQILNIPYHKIGNRTLYIDAFISSLIGEPQPAVLLVHGGGWKSGDKEMLRPLAQRIAASGFQVFAVEYRLSTEAIYPAALCDVLTAIDYLQANEKKYNIQEGKLAILGTSSGGQLASLAGQLASDKISAIINVDGILAFHHPESEEKNVASLWLGGTYEQVPEVWEQASPLFHTSQNSPPILFINSQFPRFHAGRDDMIERLDKFGIYSEVREIKNSPHTFWLFYPWFDEVVQYTLDFLIKTLK
ncbi:MAG: alpha/beta hydrolase [Cruoricaptor ignavus]|nr:alpha/beta hydrolase [Cruoricaptor ignavus]